VPVRGIRRRRGGVGTTRERDEVLMAFESANFDEDTFTDPNEYDLGRRFW
jgi:cytochrome P450